MNKSVLHKALLCLMAVVLVVGLQTPLSALASSSTSSTGTVETSSSTTVPNTSTSSSSETSSSSSSSSSGAEESGTTEADASASSSPEEDEAGIATMTAEDEIMPMAATGSGDVYTMNGTPAMRGHRSIRWLNGWL